MEENAEGDAVMDLFNALAPYCTDHHGRLDEMLPPWYKPIAPRTIIDAACVLAEHVDYWEEDVIGTIWPHRALSAFMDTCGFADASRETEFRDLLLQYATLSVDANTIRSRPADDEFHSRRRGSVREAIAEIKRWVGDDAGPLPRAGAKRARQFVI